MVAGNWLLTVLFASRPTKWTGGCAHVVLCACMHVFALVLTRSAVKSCSHQHTIGTGQRIGQRGGLLARVEKDWLKAYPTAQAATLVGDREHQARERWTAAWTILGRPLQVHSRRLLALLGSPKAGTRHCLLTYWGLN